MRGDSWRGSSWRLTISTLPGTGVSRQAAAAPDRLLPNATLPLESPPGAEAGSWLERAGRAVAPTGPPTVANDVRGTSLGRAPASRLSLPRCTVSGICRLVSLSCLTSLQKVSPHLHRHDQEAEIAENSIHCGVPKIEQVKIPFW